MASINSSHSWEHVSINWLCHSSPQGGTSFPPFDMGWPCPVICSQLRAHIVWLQSFNFKRPCSFLSCPFAALRMPWKEAQAHLLGDGLWGGERERDPAITTEAQTCYWDHMGPVSPPVDTPTDDSRIGDIQWDLHESPLWAQPMLRNWE